MGGCLSKKSTNSTCPGSLQNPSENLKTTVQLEKKKAEKEIVKKEIFVIKHRKSQDIERGSNNEDKVDFKEATDVAEPCTAADRNNASTRSSILVAAPVSTSSCTEEEVDAILIQCGRLSRNSSTAKANSVSASCGSGDDNNGNVQRPRKYSGSKRSFDFDNDNNGNEITDKDGIKGDDFDGNFEKGNDTPIGEVSDRHRQRQRQSRTVGSPSKGRRRTPSRDREQGQSQRSSSRENNSNGSGGRRISRSPGRRSESPINISSNGANSSAVRPGKMVSVPATVSSLAMDNKSNNGERHETVSAFAIKRIQVKRNVDGESAAASRTVAYPRVRSPARTKDMIFNDNNGSSNQNQQQPIPLSRSNSRKAEVSPFSRNPLGEIDNNVLVDQVNVQGLKAHSNILHQAPSKKSNANNVETECFNPLGLTRTRSSRLSCDLDIDIEALSNHVPSSYTSLLLEDIQNFHQKSNNINNNSPPFTLPDCVSKARSIVEAVADLNSSTKAKPKTEQFNLSYENGGLDDDLIKPSLHRYVTVQRGSLGEDDIEEHESSGSNSFVGSQQHWVSSSSWEPNSADSTDRYTTSSRSNTRDDDDQCPIGSRKQVISDSGYDGEDRVRRSSGIGRNRVESRAST